jgi:hypothetical protein
MCHSEAFPWDTAPRYLLRDRDTSYGRAFCDRVKAMGIEEVLTAPRSPWQNLAFVAFGGGAYALDARSPKLSSQR